MHNIRNAAFGLIIIVLILWSCFFDKGINTSNSDNKINSTTTESVVEITTDILSDRITETVEITTEEVKETTTEKMTEVTTEEKSEVTTEEYIDAEEKYIENVLSRMTIEEKVGQMFFIKNDGRFKSDIIEKYPVGGIILFAGDFRNVDKDTLKNNISSFQEASKYPILIGTDEEGGTVTRLSKYYALSEKEFQSPRAIYNNGGYEAIRKDTEEKSRLLLSYGINVNFAPVCDYCPDGGFMYQRSFGSNIEETCTYVETVVDVMHSEHIGSVLKHFPGYGNNGDTHKNIIHDKRALSQYEKEDYLPFKAGIEKGADCVLVSHNIVEAIDSENPASLSTKMHGILRRDFSFDGVIITDDLMMSGVSSLYSKDEVAVKAVLAGNDMILSTDYEVQYNSVLEAAKSGTITEERLNDSVRRILKWKINLGIISID